VAKESYTLRVVKVDGTDQCVLPDYGTLQLSLVLSDTGSIQVDYMANGKNAAQLVDEAEVRVLRNGVELRGARYLMEQRSSDEASDEGKGKRTTWNGRTWGDAILDFAKVFPPAMGASATYTASGGAETGEAFTNATPGGLMLNLIGKSQARGGCVNLGTGTFNSVTDSNGMPWPSTITKAYDVGTTYLEILKDLVSMGIVEYEFNGRNLLLYKAGTLSVDRTVTNPKVVLRKGKDLSSAPKNVSTLEVASAVLLQGENGIYVQQANAGADTRLRKEQFFQEGGVISMTTLQWLAGQRLTQTAAKTLEQTVELASLDNPKTQKPWVDYYLGDYVYVRTTQDGLVKYRVLQLMITADENGLKRGSVTLNSLFAEQAVALARQISKVEAGVVSNTTAGGPTASLDATTPNASTALTVPTSSYSDGAGNPRAVISASWAAVTSNTDATAISDLQGYLVQWKRSSDPNWTTAGTTLPTQTAMVIAALPIATAVDVRVAAYDTSAHFSAWTQASTTTATDMVAPPTPTAPTVTGPFPSVLRVAWDGLGVGAVQMPADWSRTEVHVSTVTGFAPDNTTLKGYVQKNGTLDLAVGHGLTYYVKLKTFDQYNNSAVGAQGSAAVPTMPAPSTPMVDAATFAGLLKITWDGKDSTGAVMPANLNRVEVHVSTVSGFAPDATTFRDVITNPAGGLALFTATADTTYYVKLVAYDAQGDKSAASTQASGTTRRLVDTDAIDAFVTNRLLGPQVVQQTNIANLAVGTAQMIDLSVVAAKIGTLAVNDGKVSDLSVGKLTAGTLTALVTISGTIQTAASGARVVLDATGLKAYSAAGVNTVIISAGDGSITAIGKFKTGTTGPRWDIGSTTINEIRAYTGHVSEGYPANITVDGSGNLILESADLGAGHSMLQLAPSGVSIQTPLTAFDGLTIRSDAAGSMPFLIIGFTAQTADLTQWWDTLAAGNVLARVTKNGSMLAPNLASMDDGKVVNVTVNASATSGTAAFTWNKTFASAPIATATIVSGSGNASIAKPYLTAVTAAGGTVRVDTSAALGSATTFPVHVRAYLA
jgi:hypothetical protein